MSTTSDDHRRVAEDERVDENDDELWPTTGGRVNGLHGNQVCVT